VSLWGATVPTFVGAPEGAGRVRVAADNGVERNPLPLVGRALKRLIDIVLATTGLVLGFPVLMLIAVAVRRDSPGSVLFKQDRVGADGRCFTMFKFRSMVDGNDHSDHELYVTRYIRGQAERIGGMFKLVDDPRVTRVGRWLRRTSLDELPQLWNVLRGEMSLVGPRPSLPSEVALYDDRARQRLRVRPGLTGLWQVSGRCTLSFDEMIALDVRYWQRWSLLLDLAILLRTPRIVLCGRGTA
jgi:lipopolysaccharide/colanic/teichoic acid biosynthesis glycosyltransferase